MSFLSRRAVSSAKIKKDESKVPNGAREKCLIKWEMAGDQTGEEKKKQTVNYSVLCLPNLYSFCCI